MFYLSSPFYDRDGPWEITGEGGGGGGDHSPKNLMRGKNPASSGTEKKIMRRPEKNSCRQVSGKKNRAPKKFHPPSGCLYFPLLNYHKAVMTEVFSLGTNQEAERLRPFGTGSVDQGAPFYSFPGRHFLSPVYRLALRGWLLISRRGLVSLFILWLLRPLLRFFRICQKGRKLHWSVDTMTSL